MIWNAGWRAEVTRWVAAGLIAALCLALALALVAAGLHWRSRQPAVTALAPAANVAWDARSAFYSALAEVRLPTAVTADLAVIGNPAARRYPDCVQSFARNPWDLVGFAGRLYLGLGDASNQGPSPNAGPVPVYSYDPARGDFREEAVLPEEQIDRFYPREGVLWLPGDDPRQSWHWGNLYRRDPTGGWTQYRTLPRTIHAYALAWHQGRLFAGVSMTDAVPEGVGTERFGSAVAVSTDGGEHWDLMPLGGWRIFDFLTVQGQLFAADLFPGPGIQRWLDREQRQGFHAAVYEYADVGGFRRRDDLDATQMFPETLRAGRRAAVIQGALAWQDGTVYIGALMRAGDEAPVRGAYLARSLRHGAVDVERLPLPSGALAMDLRVESDELQILFAERLSGARWRTSLWSSIDAREWKQELSFSASAPARSFERLGNDWYFGLGSLSPPPSGPCTQSDAATGTLLRWRSH